MGNVKKITGHISKKVSDKLAELYKKDQEDFEKKWANMSLFVKYGMISDEKFYDRAQKFCLLKNVDGVHKTISDYVEGVKALQTDKDDNTVLLYSTDADEQYQYVKTAKDKGYDVLELNEIIDNHFVSMLESQTGEGSAEARGCPEHGQAHR